MRTFPNFVGEHSLKEDLSFGDQRFVKLLGKAIALYTLPLNTPSLVNKFKNRRKIFLVVSKQIKLQENFIRFLKVTENKTPESEVGKIPNDE